MTILREWRGRAKSENVAAAVKHYQTHIKPLMMEKPGFIRASVSSRDVGSIVEFVLLSYWEDMDSMTAFAGAIPDKAVMGNGGIYDLLEDTEMFVRIYEVLDET